MERCLLLGNGGREAVLAENICKNYSVYSVCTYENPTIVAAIRKSKGKYLIGDPFDKELVKKFIQENNIKYCVISSDNLLRDGLIDVARSLGLKTFGATSKGAKIEWSKSYALDIVKKINPSMVINNYQVTSLDELKSVVDKYTDDEFVVKPDGLTGGKGVKVGGIHFKGKASGYQYAKECFEGSGRVIIQDKVEGKEFTVMALTDGKRLVRTPVTFDYPYRFNNDKGPGTGGMGCLSFKNGLLPFLTQDDVKQCMDLMKRTVQYINRDSLEFNGVIYGGFFKTKDGIKFIEFNSRFGDPEALNVLNSLRTPFGVVLRNIFNMSLNVKNCVFKKNYTFTVYVVTKQYAIENIKEPCTFSFNESNIKNSGVKIYFANAKKVGKNQYQSVSNSRLLALTVSDRTLEQARYRVYQALKDNVDEKLDYRTDIGQIYKH